MQLSRLAWLAPTEPSVSRTLSWVDDGREPGRFTLRKACSEPTGSYHWRGMRSRIDPSGSRTQRRARSPCRRRSSASQNPARVCRYHAHPHTRRGGHRPLGDAGPPDHATRSCRCGSRPRLRRPMRLGPVPRPVRDRRVDQRRRLPSTNGFRALKAGRNQVEEALVPIHPMGLWVHHHGDA